MTTRKRFPSATQNRFRLERIFRAEGWLAVERASEYTHLKTWMRRKDKTYTHAELQEFRRYILIQLVAKNFRPEEQEYKYGPWINGDSWEIDLDGHTICISCKRTCLLRPG